MKFPTDGIPGDEPNLPKYYARVSKVNLGKERDDPFTKYYESRDNDIFGTYTFIEYFFYFIYNDAWNQHQGDWDCMVELYIKNDRTYMITHMHHSQWICKFPETSPDINSWLKSWDKLRKKEMGTAYVLNHHPYVFVARGAHGGYPTPGYSLHGLNIPDLLYLEDILVNSDERQIGRLCILPDNMNEETVRTNLRFANIEVNKLRFGKWKKPELIVQQPWCKYQGKWGEDTKYLGWDGPQNPLSRESDKGNLKSMLAEIKYETRIVVKNWHGV